MDSWGKAVVYSNSMSQTRALVVLQKVIDWVREVHESNNWPELSFVDYLITEHAREYDYAVLVDDNEDSEVAITLFDAHIIDLRGEIPEN
jgi:hypothetical protein